MARGAVRGRLGLSALLGLALLVGGAPPVQAHGDTVRVSYRAVQPKRLVVEAGTTVHFHNANSSGAVCTVVFDDALAESPPLGRAEGWHHTFDTPGEFRFVVKEYPSRTGLIVVIARP